MKRFIHRHTLLVAVAMLAQNWLTPTTWASEQECETPRPSASSNASKTGITISSTKNDDGTRTVRKMDKNGKLISEEKIAPRGTARPSAKSYDPTTGITITSTKNAGGSRTVRTTDKNGKLISKEVIPPHGTPLPFAETYDPTTGVTVTYTANADGSKNVRLTNKDGILIGERRVPKWRTRPPSASSYYPKPGKTRYAYANLLVNGNAEVGDTRGWVDKDSAWSADAEVTPHGGSFFFWPAKKPLARTELYQDVDLSHIAEKPDAGDLYLQLSGSLCNWEQSPCDQSIMILEVLDGKGTMLFRSPEKVHQDSNWKSYKINTTCPVGARVLRVRLIAQRRCGTDNDGYFDDIVLGLSTKPFSKE